MPSSDVQLILAPPQFASPLFQVSTTETTLLPTELVHLLNQVYFLHVLSTEPRKVLPPGKSLLSVLSRTHTENRNEGADILKDRVQHVVHKAFWDEALESLSNPTPQSQLPRLKLLYSDLHVALSPLLPSDHIVLITLSSPLSPTSSPLLSAITHLRETISALRERCAPIRDAYLDELLMNLEAAPSASANKKLAELIVDTVKSILSFADVMKDDLSQFVLGAMSEKRLKGIIAEQAKSQERRLTLDIWNLEKIKSHWADWIEGSIGGNGEQNSALRKFVLRLIEVLKLPTPVSCRLPTRAPVSAGVSVHPNSPIDINELPPPLLFSTPSLLYIQNYLQALIIAASLQSLVPCLPNTSMPSSDHNLTFVGRIWTLLKAEIDGEPYSGETKIINLADEVVQAHKHAVTGISDNVDEKRLRAAVEKILRTNDPVFVLLQKRLLSALLSKLLEAMEQPLVTNTIPEHLQSGRSMKAGIRHGLDLSQSREADGDEAEAIDIKGFDDLVLAKAVGEAFVQLKRCIQWTIGVWRDVIQ